MKWIESKITDLGDSVKFELTVEGKELELSTDDTNWVSATKIENENSIFEITVKKESKVGQEFFVKDKSTLWGYLSFPEVKIDCEYKKQFIKEGSEENKSMYCSFIKSDFKDKELVRCEFPAFGIVYNDEFIPEFDKGKRVYPLVQVYNEQGELELEMDNDESSTKKGVNDNNHPCYIMIPKGKKKIVISNKKESDFPLLTEVFRQTSELPSVRYEWGDSMVIKPNEKREYDADFTYQGLRDELFKINCVTRY